MNAAEHCVVEARMACLDDATAFVEAFCRQHGLARADMLRLVLVVEELFTNTVEHGHGGDSDAAVRIDLRAHDDEVELRYEDRAPAFDGPAAAPQGLDAPLQERTPGGLGLHIVSAMAASLRRAREDGCNRVWFVLRRE